MKKIFETETYGQLSKQEFEKFKAELSKNSIFTRKETVKRLSVQITDHARSDLDTRIRITNGKVEIMQKVGDWNAASREELSVGLQATAEDVFRVFLILDNILNADTVQKTVIQMESYTFLTDDFEVKLTHQLGGGEAYNFEVETFAEGLDPKEICKEFNLIPDLAPKDAVYWEDFNKRVNLDIRKIGKEQLFDIIRSYCS